FPNLADGAYTLHFFATDCASTEELKFTAKGPGQGNWADFNSTVFMIDTVDPTVNPITLSAPNTSGNIFGVGTTVTATFSCSDNAGGSGILAPGGCVGTGGILSGGTFKTTAAQVGTLQTFTVTATDVAGNTTTSKVTYTVVGSSELAVLNLASLTVNTGSNLTYNIALLNLGPSVANNVTLTDVLPAGTTPVSASFGTVTCNASGCTDVKTLPNTCTVGSTVTCLIPSVPFL